MYLIKCAKCNTLVEVKTEFLMLCPKCKLKLENNYQEWKQQKENKGKNFQVYLKEVCISQEELEEQQRQDRLQQLYSPKKNKARKIANLAFAAVVVAVAIVLATRLGRLVSDGWMRDALVGINSGISVVGAALATTYTLRRKRFQNFLPLLVALIALAATVVTDMVFFIVTDNL